MADEEKTEKNEVQPPPKKSKTMLIIILFIAGLVIGIGGAVGFLMFRNVDVEEKGQAQQEQQQDQKAVKPSELGPVMALDPFIVNLLGSGGRNYLKIEIGLELSAKEVELEVSNKMPQIKDAILLLLSTKTFDDIGSSHGKVMLKNQILQRLNSFLATGTIKHVYFTSFVVQ